VIAPNLRPLALASQHRDPFRQLAEAALDLLAILSAQGEPTVAAQDEGWVPAL
jgi:hypothetical protein